jgi:ketosteroid isomerase-like protein
MWRQWYHADERVIVEIRGRSWLKTASSDVMDQRTCVVLTFRDAKSCAIRDYTDAHVHEQFLTRHREALPKFRRLDG